MAADFPSLSFSRSKGMTGLLVDSYVHSRRNSFGAFFEMMSLSLTVKLMSVHNSHPIQAGGTRFLLLPVSACKTDGPI